MPVTFTPSSRARLSSVGLSSTTIREILGLTQIYATQYGVVADGVTDDTAAWNAIIAVANADPIGQIAIVCPKGNSVVTALDPILNDCIWFVGEEGPGTFWFKHSGDPCLTWGSATDQTLGGGVHGIGFWSPSAPAGRRSIYVRNGARMNFTDIQAFEVSILLQVGLAGGTTGSTIHVNGLRGACLNVASPLFDLQKCLGFFLNDYQIYVDATVGATNTSRHFIQMTNDTCDTILVGSGLAELFARPIKAVAATGTNHHRINIDFGATHDNCLEGCLFQTTGTGTITGLDYDGYITVLNGHGLEIDGVGNWLHTISVRIQAAAKNGIYLKGAHETIICDKTLIYNTNTLASTWDGIYVESVAGLTIGSCRVGLDVSGLGLTGSPRYGCKILTSDRVFLTGALLRGSTSALNYDGATTNLMVDGCQGLDDFGRLRISINGSAPQHGLEVIPTNMNSDGIVIKRYSAGTTNASYWGFQIENASAGDGFIVGQTSTTFTTGGFAGWIGNSDGFWYYPSTMKIGTGIGSTAAMSLTSANKVLFASAPIGVKTYTVANLPSAATGDVAFATDCRVFNGAGTQEGAGVGTGGLVSYNGTNWKIAGTNVTAVA
jgi:hypothetical protein